jgi:glycosyltransferase involved in cell wall biosynthesis
MEALKVCIITDSLFTSGGIATATRELSHQLALAGHEVRAISCKDESSDPRKLLRVCNLGIKKRPLALWDIPETSFRASKNIQDLIKDVDVVHVHGPLAMTRLLSKKSINVPWVATVHGTFQKELIWLKSYPKTNVDMIKYWLGTRLFISFESWLYRTLSSQLHFIAVSQQTKDDLIKIGVKEKRISVVPNGVNTSIYQPLPMEESRRKLETTSAIGPNEKIVLSVNFIEPRKGTHVLLEAFLQATKRLQNVHCIIVGASDPDGYQRYLANLVDNLGLQKKVHFTGFVAEDTLPYYFNSCNVFVLPSLAEGAPLVIPMAMACRKPVIATTACAAEEYLEPECTTMPGNYEELAEKLIYYLSNEKEADNLADRLHRKATMNLTWDKIAEKTISVYRSILQDC